MSGIQKVLIGPFHQLLTLRGLPEKGPLNDDQLEIIPNAGVIVQGGFIQHIGEFEELYRQDPDVQVQYLKKRLVAIPGLIDSHTHICFAGSRAKDYSMRVGGKSYLEIAREGGGILTTVNATREASEEELTKLVVDRANTLFERGITTAEVKSGYCLNVEGELKMLRAIRHANDQTEVDLISTCLAAHMKPKDFEGSNAEYLEQVVHDLLPKIQEEGLSNRVDIFIEQTAFQPEEADRFLQMAGESGFEITVHADQFTPFGTEIALKNSALSADHLEASGENEIKALANSDTVATALPGASFGLGCKQAPGRKLLDAGASLAIASDWNPGSAPHGDLLTQAAIYGAYQKLTVAETLVAITFRAAKALNLSDRGVLDVHKMCDIAAFQCDSYHDILYHQGTLQPESVWKNGINS